MNDIIYKMPDINTIINNRVNIGLVTIGSNPLDIQTGYMYKDPDRGICIEGVNINCKGTITWTNPVNKSFGFKTDDGKEYKGVIS